MSDDSQQQTTAQREYQQYAATDGGKHPATEEPDVLLDVPKLGVDRINLEVEGLRAHVSVLAELANLVQLSVGVDARLDRVKLEIEGVEAQALLKVRLEHVRAILEKALDTIAENPQILKGLAQRMDRTAEQMGGAARDAVGGIEGAQDTVSRGAGQALNESGEVSEEAVVGEASVAEEAAGEEKGEVEATPAAERKAEELGVDLSQVEGTGSEGRIILKDVQSAAQEE